MYEFHYYELQVLSDTILNFLQWQYLNFLLQTHFCTSDLYVVL
jgi:hypothetical protein